MKYTVEMGSSTMIYVLNFRKIGSGIQKLAVGEELHGYRDTQTHRKQDVPINLLLFFQTKIRLTMTREGLKKPIIYEYSETNLRSYLSGTLSDKLWAI
jgi:hypothetical protein